MGNEKYDLTLKSLYEVFSSYSEEEINITIKTFEKAFNSLKILRKKYGFNYNGEGSQSLTYMEDMSLKSFLSRIDLRLKCISHLLRNGTNKEDIEKLFKNKDDNEINIMVRTIIEKYEGIPKQEEDIIYDSLTKIITVFNTDEKTLLEALNEIEDEDKKFSYIYTYGIGCLPLTKKEILKKLSITKIRYDKYIKEVQKQIPRLIEKSKNKKAFRLQKLKLKEEEKQKEEFIQQIITTKEEPKKEEKIEKLKEEVITPVIIEEPQIKVDTINEEVTDPITKKIVVEEKQVEESSLEQDIKTTPSINDDDYDTMLISLYVGELDLDMIEKSNLDPFKKAILTIAYYDKGKQKRIANLYISYLQERYRNNLLYLEILNKIMMFINAIKSEFNISNYENIFNVKPIEEKVTTVIIEQPKEEVIEQIEEPEKEQLQFNFEEPVVEIKEEPVIETKDEPIDIVEPVEKPSISKLEIGIVNPGKVNLTQLPQDIEILEPPVEDKEKDLILQEISDEEDKKKKKEKTIKDLLYDDILQVELELYSQMHNDETRTKAIKAWDILDCMTSKNAKDKDALEKVINLLKRLDKRYTKESVKGLTFKTNYDKYTK